MSDNNGQIADAVEIMDRRYGGSNEWDKLVAEESLKTSVGQVVHDLRDEAGLSQTKLAALVGTSQSIISRVENADYEGSALEMLARVCMALQKDIKVRRIDRGVRISA